MEWNGMQVLNVYSLNSSNFIPLSPTSFTPTKPDIDAAYRKTSLMHIYSRWLIDKNDALKHEDNCPLPGKNPLPTTRKRFYVSSTCNDYAAYNLVFVLQYYDINAPQ